MQQKFSKKQKFYYRQILSIGFNFNFSPFACSHQVCYKLQLQEKTRSFYGYSYSYGYKCVSAEEDPDNSRLLEYVKLPHGDLLIITSPDFGTGKTYPSDMLCHYSIPPCPNSNLHYRIMWTRGNFELEEAIDIHFLENICLDLVEITIPFRYRWRTRDPCVKRELCGTQGDCEHTNFGPPPMVSI